MIDEKTMKEINDRYEITENGVVIPKKHKLHLQVPIAFIKSKEYNHYEKIIYMYIWSYGVFSKTAFPSIQTIADDLSIGRTGIKKHIRSLEDKGGILRISRFEDEAKKIKATNQYYLAEIDNVSGSFDKESFKYLKLLFPNNEQIINKSNKKQF